MTYFQPSHFVLPAGGSGCLAHHLATVYPDVHVTVFDLPQVVEVSLQQQPEEMKSRVSFIGGKRLE